MKHILKLITISSLASSFLLGATPTIGDIEKEIKIPDIQKEQVEIPSIKPMEYKAPMSDSGRLILVKDFKVIGNNHISSDDLQKFFAESKNKELTFNQLQEIASNITKHYREKGYFVSRAYFPAQNILENDNVLEIAVIEGSYGKFKLNNSSLVNDEVIQKMIDDAKANDNVISTYTLERAMLIINDTPGATVATVDVMPGSDVGTSDFEIITKTSTRADGYIVADNYGGRYTGKDRVMVGANINSPFEIGDKISAFGLVSNGSNLKNGKIAYEVPLSPSGVKGEISYSQTNYALTKEYAALESTGISKTIEGKISYPIIKTKNENLNTYTSLLSKELKDEVKSTTDITKKSSQSIKAGLDYSKDYLAFDNNTKSSINTYMTYGKLNFDDEAKKIIDENGANTNGNYLKINVDISHNITFTPKLSLDNSLKSQHAFRNKNLDGSEDFSVGGSSGVKLYPDGELSAENGYIFTTELKYQLPQLNSLNTTVGTFYDRGRAFMVNDNVNFEVKSLQDVGVGIYNSYDKFFSKVQVAWNVNSKEVTSEPNRNSRILFQCGMSF